VLFGDWANTLVVSGLNELGDGRLQKGCLFYKMLQCRMTNRFDEDSAERALFDDAIHLFYRREDVFVYNTKKLYAQKKPIRTINATHLVEKDRSLPRKVYQDCPATLKICIGAPVRLNCNVCVAIGLFNGAHGVIVDIIDNPDADEHSLPICVLVQMDESYKGTSCLDEDQFPRVVPIFPRQICHEQPSKAWTNMRTQIPLSLDWARTIHKAQGMTLSRVFVDVNHSQSLFYVFYHILQPLKTVLITAVCNRKRRSRCWSRISFGCVESYL